MITSLRLKDFKNFADETLRMGPFTVLVGANASGKSNVRDAFRFLHGIGRGYRLPDIIGGRYGAGGQVEWEPIRGAVDEIVRFGHESFLLEVGVRLPSRAMLPAEGTTPPWADLSLRGRARWERRGRYRIAVARESSASTPFQVADELLAAGWAWEKTVFTSTPERGDPIWRERHDPLMALRMAKTGTQRKFGNRVNVSRDRPALVQIQEQKRVVRDHKFRARLVQTRLGSMRFLDLSPEKMRQPAFPGQTILGDGGDNLPTVLRDICSDSKRRETFVEWTRELTPMDVEDFEFPVDPTTGRVQLALRESGGRQVSAYAASDGTLRFLAMLAALLGTNPAGLYVFEEIDNGIHPSRLRLLIDLIETQTGKGGVQVLTTTHSPELLSMVNDETFKHTSVLCRRPDTHDTVIRPVAKLPDAERLRESQGLGRLHASGWMEHAVSFAGDGGTGKS
ncbi:MAG: ATP-binding protein [Acidobacteria bacterium]|nr:ATP-binding protein [Acidobacteriota bacterium]